MIIGLGKAESTEDDDALPPGMTQILEKIAEQESKYSIILFSARKNHSEEQFAKLLKRELDIIGYPRL